MQNKLLTAKAAVPDYDRTKLVPRIVHLGFGAFHRAHQGVYADILAADHGSDWGYCEVNLIGGEQQIADLKQQDNLYTVAEMSADAWTARVVGVVKNALHAQVDGLESVLAAMSEPQVAIVFPDHYRERVLPFSGDRSIDVRQPDDCRRSTKPKTAKNCARRCG
ncbi:sugar dehydrogenase [Citrobacter braakii]|nr:sugar dehydrogenase [Citrobacter braakii]